MSRRRKRLSVLSMALRMVKGLSERWFLVVLAAFLVSPIGPHVRIEYTFRQVGDYRSYISCTYFGSRGMITPYYVEGCPVFAWIDARQWVR